MDSTNSSSVVTHQHFGWTYPLLVFMARVVCVCWGVCGLLWYTNPKGPVWTSENKIQALLSQSTVVYEGLFTGLFLSDTNLYHYPLSPLECRCVLHVWPVTHDGHPDRDQSFPHPLLDWCVCHCGWSLHSGRDGGRNALPLTTSTEKEDRTRQSHVAHRHDITALLSIPLYIFLC